MELDPEREVFLVQLPFIAMQLATQVPSACQTAAAISDMLRTWRHSQAAFAGHSFGTVVLAWVSKYAPQLIARASFLDPVVFLLAKSDVAYNFLYRRPESSSQSLMNFFAAKELGVAYTLARHFVWHEIMLWADELDFAQGAAVVLSGRDSIVPAHCVRLYFEAYNRRISHLKGVRDETCNQTHHPRVRTGGPEDIPTAPRPHEPYNPDDSKVFMQELSDSNYLTGVGESKVLSYVMYIETTCSETPGSTAGLYRPTASTSARCAQSVNK